MAHVGRVRQVVGAVEPREQAVQVGRLEARPAGRVEDHRIRVEGLELTADRRERFVPGAGHVFVRARLVAQRMGEAPLLFEIEVAPAAKLRHRVFGEEGGRAAPAREFPEGRLRSVFAELEGMVVGRLRPGTGHAHEALGLVLACERLDGGRGAPFLAENLRDAFERSPPARGAVVLDRSFVRHLPVLPAAPAICGMPRRESAACERHRSPRNDPTSTGRIRSAVAVRPNTNRRRQSGSTALRSGSQHSGAELARGHEPRSGLGRLRGGRSRNGSGGFDRGQGGSPVPDLRFAASGMMGR